MNLASMADFERAPTSRSILASLQSLHPPSKPEPLPTLSCKCLRINTRRWPADLSPLHLVPTQKPVAGIPHLLNRLPLRKRTQPGPPLCTPGDARKPLWTQSSYGNRESIFHFLQLLSGACTGKTVECAKCFRCACFSIDFGAEGPLSRLFSSASVRQHNCLSVWRGRFNCPGPSD